MLQGEPASAPVVVNDRSYTIRVRFPQDVRKTLDSIRKTMLVSGTGKTATIGSLAERGGDSRRDRNPPRQPAAQRAGDRALRESSTWATA